MTSYQANIGGIELAVLDGWGELESEDGPFCLTRITDGVGAFQISGAVYRSGPMPDMTEDVLSEMLDGFTRGGRFGEKLESHSYRSGRVRIARSEFHDIEEGNYVCIWYASNGRSLAKLTYTVDWGAPERADELADCEAMVLAISFPDDVGN